MLDKDNSTIHGGVVDILSQQPEVNEIILQEPEYPKDRASLVAICKDIAKQGFIARVKFGAVQYMSGGKWYNY